ncbi:MAG: HAD family hydrolase [Acutalibacter sp.]|jgi:phosphoglycolate phosphatase
MEKLVIWDWNGTLLNDVNVALQAMDTMLARRDLPLLKSLDRYREIFTFPVREYYQAAGLNLEREPFEELAVEWTQLYHRFYPSCGLYPGALETVRSLREQGFRQVIVSASQQQALDRQVEEHGLSGFFQARLGISDIYAGSKAGLARDYLEGQGLSPAQALFVGDTLHDWEVAREAACGCILLAQGHQSRGRLETAGVPVLEEICQVPVLLARDTAQS